MNNPDYRREIDLPKKPLVEAIFELRWLLKTDQQQPGIVHDPGFRILLARFYDRVENTHPHAIDLPIVNVPEALTPHTVRHQFRPSPDTWPVFQLGPGILTANETTNYSWDSFCPVVNGVIELLFSAYPDAVPLQPHAVTLRYVNAIAFDPGSIDPVEFLRTQLHTNVAIDNEIFRNLPSESKPDGAKLNVRYPLPDIGSGEIQFATGQRDDRPAILWENRIHLSGPTAPQTPDALGVWLQRAHRVAEDWFFALSRGDLLDKFEGK